MRELLRDRSDEPVVRSQAATTLGTIGTVDDLQVLIDGLDDGETRIGAIKAWKRRTAGKPAGLKQNTAGQPW